MIEHLEEQPSEIKGESLFEHIEKKWNRKFREKESSDI